MMTSVVSMMQKRIMTLREPIFWLMVGPRMEPQRMPGKPISQKSYGMAPIYCGRGEGCTVAASTAQGAYTRVALYAQTRRRTDDEGTILDRSYVPIVWQINARWAAATWPRSVKRRTCGAAGSHGEMAWRTVAKPESQPTRVIEVTVMAAGEQGRDRRVSKEDAATKRESVA